MRLSVLFLAASTIAMANVPLAENSRLGSLSFAHTSHQGISQANSFNASGLAGCLCDERRRSRSSSKERDAETGLDYFGARYMSSAQGRFTSPDAPFADQKANNPQSWNLYSYVRNNPLRYTDPTGHCLYPGGDCLQYVIGGAKAVANIVPDTATLLNRGINALTGSNFPDAARFEGTNYDQRSGMEAASVVMLVSPVAEAGATAAVEAIGTGARAATEATAAAVGAADAAQAGGRTSGAAAGLRVGNQTFADVSTGGAPRVNHPAVQRALDNVPAAQRSPYHGACAEIGCLNQAADAGVNPQGGTMRAVNIRKPGNANHATPKPPCPTCEHVQKQMGVN